MNDLENWKVTQDPEADSKICDDYFVTDRPEFQQAYVVLAPMDEPEDPVETNYVLYALAVDLAEWLSGLRASALVRFRRSALGIALLSDHGLRVSVSNAGADYKAADDMLAVLEHSAEYDRYISRCESLAFWLSGALILGAIFSFSENVLRFPPLLVPAIALNSFSMVPRRVLAQWRLK